MWLCAVQHGVSYSNLFAGVIQCQFEQLNFIWVSLADGLDFVICLHVLVFVLWCSVAPCQFTCISTCSICQFMSCGLWFALLCSPFSFPYEQLCAQHLSIYALWFCACSFGFARCFLKAWCFVVELSFVCGVSRSIAWASHVLHGRVRKLEPQCSWHWKQT